MRFRTLLAIVLCLGSFSALAQPLPKVTLVHPATEALIGDDVKFCVLFENAGTATGFAPFLDFVFDRQGADGVTSSLPCDGVSFVSAEVVNTNPHVPLTPVVPPATLSPCGSGSATHPFAATTSGWPGAYPPPLPPYPHGSQLVTLALPFGSFQPSQGPLRVEVTAHVDKLADLNVLLTVQVLGGFRYGATATNTSAPIFNPSSQWQVEMITPKVVML